MNTIRYLLIAAAWAATSLLTAPQSQAQQLLWLDCKAARPQPPTPGRATLDISALSSGLHWLTITAQNEAGVWCSPVSRSFIVPCRGTDGKTIVEHQYWIDGRMEALVTQEEQPTLIDISSLTPGIHRLTVRVKDNTGLYSSPVTKTFIVPYSVSDVSDKHIVEHQYWIDGRMEALVTQEEQPTLIDISSLTPGIHRLTVRVKDNAGLYSSPVTKNFIVPTDMPAVSDKQIVEHQYWIDDRMEASVTGAEQPTLIDISSLTPGMHTFNVRVKDNAGLYSSPISQFFIVPYSEVDASGKQIVEHQYWIDGRMEARVTQAEPPTLIDISSLTPGLHTFTVRAKDNTGQWSSQVSRYFHFDGNALREATITHCLYWFDDDWAHTQSVALDAESGAITIDISDVEAGPHTLWWRCRDSRGALSQPYSLTFESTSFYAYTLPSSGIGTFSAKCNVVLPDDLKAYTCTSFSPTESSIGMVRTGSNVIPAETGVILVGNPDETYTLTGTDSQAPTIASNALVAVTESRHVNATDGDYTNFMLKDGKFIRISDNATSMMPRCRAYLPLLTSISGSEVSEVTLRWGDETTAIDKVVHSDVRPAQNMIIYDLSGQRLSSPRKGINIINGIKIIVK